ncbi:release factor glutamine methyltransferase [Roseibium hamelinense]|uniref:Release factor glutamine methyltransferase n=1 Tax=Roseibium hamelinense TaxID=150831 RepID=A0A562SEW7_9HYPH|nr:peptide chain release factor N(5)-glutamine methyltransferase [Roseibium hamelinense]MTI42849.1 peptide chain release factor N(5)-glutamine methyltransferase [Roseibium hamelinense]TWI79881.1 release factor glutamine methyltransferase [Roseibium hamelinense]
MHVGPLYRTLRDRFRKAGLATPELDARILVGYAAGIPPSNVVICEDLVATGEVRRRALAYSEARLEGWPVGRILGMREFYGLEFRLNDATLEPRPDTEILVDVILERSPTNRGFRFVDVGTGTGAIAIALLNERPAWIGVATDISEQALICAKHNAQRHMVHDRLLVARSDFCSAVSQGLDCLVSNPPYIRTNVVNELDPEVRKFDPVAALDGGADGLDAYRAILAHSARVLRKNGRVAFEIGFDQEAAVAHLLREASFLDVETIYDLAGKPRVITGLIAK